MGRSRALGRRPARDATGRSLRCDARATRSRAAASATCTSTTDAVAYLRETRGERLLCLAARASHDAISTPFTNLETLYGDDANDGVLPADGPAFHIWRIHYMADVAFEEVDKIYDNGVQAVFELTLEAHDGEFLVLVGPSGCGKTTALRMVAGLEDISGGTVKIGGRVVNDVSSKERDIAMVFQNYALYPHLSVAENIAFGLRLRKTDKKIINERVTWAAKMLDLTPYLERRPKELSGGQRQRVAMGRAIVRQPQVFLMDEPLSNLDAKLRVQMRADIAKLQRELGVTTMYVTHDQVEAMTMGDRVAVMSKGRLQQVDAPQRLYDRPENLFVAGFIGTPPMNLLEGTASVNGGVTVDLGGNKLPIADEALAQYPRLREYNGRPGDRRPARRRPPSRARVTRACRRSRPASSSSSRSAASRWRTSRSTRARFAARRPSSTSRSPQAADDAESVVGSRPNLVASFPPHVQLRLGDDVIDRGRHEGAALLRRSLGCAASLAARSPPARRLRWPARAGGSDVLHRRSAASRRCRRQSSLASQRIYFVMPDRYANGSTANDHGGLSGPRTKTGFDPTDPALLPRRRPGRAWPRTCSGSRTSASQRSG